MMVIPVDPTESGGADYRHQTSRSIRGPWLSRSRGDGFAGFHFRSEAQDESPAEATVQSETGD